MTKDEIDASGAPHSCIRSTFPPSKEVALSDELRAFCAAAPHDYPGHNIELFERAERSLRAAIPTVGMREALEASSQMLEYLRREARSWGKDFTVNVDHALDKNRNALAALQFVQPPAGEGLEAALRDIISWKEDTLGVRPKVQGPYDCAPEITEAFDRGARMAFYRCAIRASAALAALPPVSGDGRK